MLTNKLSLKLPPRPVKIQCARAREQVPADPLVGLANPLRDLLIPLFKVRRFAHKVGILGTKTSELSP